MRSSPVEPPFEIRFLEKLQRLLAEGDFTSTYKFAVLLALTELCSELGPGYPDPSPSFTTWQLAEKVITIYWPQVRPFPNARASEDGVLLQNARTQAAIVTRLASFQAAFLGEDLPATHLEGLKRRHAARYARLVHFVEWKLIEMPLPRLQRFPSGIDEFIYRISWEVSDVEPRGGRLKRVIQRHQRGESTRFDNLIRMQPGVAATLARLRGIVRDLVESRWILKVRNLDPSVREDPSLHEHLFGLARADLTRVRGDLIRIQAGRCFYCAAAVRSAEVDHFIPWSLSRNDRIENLVASCRRCNSRKRQFLADFEFLDRWVERLSPGGALRDQVLQLAAEADWLAEPEVSLSLAEHSHDQYPAEAGLWHLGNECRAWSKPRVIGRLRSARTGRGEPTRS